jgi:GMP synthase (glutamine-hydrolysing)
VHVLAVIHGTQVRAGVFGDVVEERGHTLEEWSLAWERPLPRPLDDYGAVLVLGGAMHADQDEHHPWLREENLFLQRLLDLRLPMLGVCLGAQLIAKAAHAAVHPAERPEIGWHRVELTPDAAGDPLFARLPEAFDAFQWHYYTYDVPAGATELARSEVCTQAYRLGECAWGIQFHAEVTLQEIDAWLADKEEYPADPAEVAAESRRGIDGWNAIGRELCGAFVEAAERVGAPV